MRKLSQSKQGKHKSFSLAGNLVSLVCLVCLALSLMSLYACDFRREDINVFRDRSEDYRGAAPYPTVQIPSGVSAEPRSDVYDIP